MAHLIFSLEGKKVKIIPGKICYEYSSKADLIELNIDGFHIEHTPNISKRVAFVTMLAWYVQDFSNFASSILDQTDEQFEQNCTQTTFSLLTEKSDETKSNG